MEPRPSREAASRMLPNQHLNYAILRKSSILRPIHTIFTLSKISASFVDPHKSKCTMARLPPAVRGTRRSRPRDSADGKNPILPCPPPLPFPTFAIPSPFSVTYLRLEDLLRRVYTPLFIFNVVFLRRICMCVLRGK
jgi:hypothetical protein